MRAITFWRRALREGAAELNSTAGWAGSIILVLGVAAGIAVPVVYHHSPLLIAVVLLGLLVVVVALGSYRVWRETDSERNTAVTERDAARDVIADRREAQARLVEVYRDIGRERRGAEFGTGIPNPEGVIIRVENKSKLPIRDLIISWKQGTRPCDDSDPVTYLEGGGSVTRFHRFPDGVDSDDDKSLFSADVYFKDANQVSWCTTPDGNLEEALSD
jgi:hypothetical protein